MELTAGALTLVATMGYIQQYYSLFTFSWTRFESVYVMVECSYFVVDGMSIEMYGESWITGLLIQPYTA